MCKMGNILMRLINDRETKIDLASVETQTNEEDTMQLHLINAP